MTDPTKMVTVTLTIDEAKLIGALLRLAETLKLEICR